MDSVGVYLHFPWCRRHCPYCDFAIELGPPPHAAYADAVIAELARRRGEAEGTLASIYFGGGTPSLWEPDELARVIDAIRISYAATAPGKAPREITIEANPVDCTDAKLRAWRAAGIDRISIGIQSHEPEELVVLGRDHRFGDGPAALARVLAFGGFTVSVDFILGTPTRHAARSSWLPEIVASHVPHLSVYELTIEERTPFGRMARDGELVPRDEDTLYELYVEAHERLTTAGFEHYEISSFARPGRRAVHNSLYWQGRQFLGLGASAASLAHHPDGTASRATNPRRSVAYLAGAAAEVVRYQGLAQRIAHPEGERICPTLRGFLMADRVAAMIG
ncbi:MAG: coproporphyrinogen-III oxidase family protein [Proteobacteria bacterium]|nr:coproporphyrinogen-III oxidase family protein [Pseudomonadota bacterium]